MKCPKCDTEMEEDLEDSSEWYCPKCNYGYRIGRSFVYPVDERTFYAVLEKLKDVRRWAAINQLDPWAFRQAMITVMDIDTAVAFEAGIEADALAKFDEAAKEKAKEFIDSVPDGLRSGMGA